MSPPVIHDTTTATFPDLCARSEQLRDLITGAERAGDHMQARALFLERLRIGRAIVDWQAAQVGRQDLLTGRAES